MAVMIGARDLGLPHRYRFLALLWLCFIVRGFYYASVLPLWEGFDEVGYLIDSGSPNL